MSKLTVAGLSSLPQSRSLADNADGTIGLTLRAAVAAIPFVGGSLSVLIESRLAARQSERISLLFNRIAEIERTISNDSKEPFGSLPFSETLLEHATNATLQTSDDKRPLMFANMLFSDADTDPTELMRRLLIDIGTVLTRYEIALLLHICRDEELKPTTEFSKTIFDMHTSGTEFSDVRKFSLGRLSTFGLIGEAREDTEVTSLGLRLLSAI